MVKCLLVMWETRVWSLGWEDLEKEMATHSSTLAWKIPWTGEPGRLHSMGSQKVDRTEQLYFHFFAFSLSIYWVLLNVCMLNHFSCVWLCDPMECNLPGSSVHGIFQARVLEWVAISFSRGPSWPRDQTHIFCWGDILLLCLVAQLCLTLCNPIDCSPPGSSVHGILQARILEWVALLSSRGSS